MKLTLTQDDGSLQEYDFQPTRLMSPEAEAIEDAGGPAWTTFEQFGRKFMSGSQRAYRVALWVCMKRAQPGIRLSDVSFRVDQLTVAYSDEETRRIREAIEADPDLDEDQRDNLLGLIGEGEEVEADPALAAQGGQAVDFPKDPPVNSETDVSK